MPTSSLFIPKSPVPSFCRFFTPLTFVFNETALVLATFTVPEPADDSSSLCWALLLLVLTIFVPCFGLFGCVYVVTLSLARAHVMRYLLSHRSSGSRC